MYITNSLETLNALINNKLRIHETLHTCSAAIWSTMYIHAEGYSNTPGAAACMFTKFRLTLSTLHNWHITHMKRKGSHLHLCYNTYTFQSWWIYAIILIKYLYNVMLLGKMGIGYVLDGYTGVWDNGHIII